MNNTRFSLPHLKLRKDQKLGILWRLYMSFTFFCFGRLEKDVEKCKVESSAYERTLSKIEKTIDE